MRVIAGKARGIQLKTPDGMETRPTIDRVKEALFSIIQFDIPGTAVLDLFGGTGQLGIEALSRGAQKAVFIGNHDEGTGVPVNAVAAALILADKADVRRSRVRNQDETTFDIHDRVNYSVRHSELKIDPDRTQVTLTLSVDTRYGSVMDYFEIFLGRMILCRKAAEKLGLQFRLVINGQSVI